MRQPVRTARHDPALGLEAYCLQGVERPFPCQQPPQGLEQPQIPGISQGQNRYHPQRLPQSNPFSYSMAQTVGKIPPH